MSLFDDLDQLNKEEDKLYKDLDNARSKDEQDAIWEKLKAVRKKKKALFDKIQKALDDWKKAEEKLRQILKT